MVDVETYKLNKRLVEQAFPAARILDMQPGSVTLDQEGWFKPQMFLIRDGALVRYSGDW